MALKSKLSRLLTTGNLACPDPPLDPATLPVDEFQLGQANEIPHMIDTLFYRWQERYRLEGCDALADKTPRPARVWNRNPDDVRDRLITLALDRAELSAR